MIKEIKEILFPKRETTTTAVPTEDSLSTEEVEETEVKQEVSMEAGQIWRREGSNPFHDDSSEIEILEIKEGWAKYVYLEIPNAYASTDPVSYLLRVYDLKA